MWFPLNFIASSQFSLLMHQLLMWRSCCCSGMFTYPSYLCILQEQRLCCVLCFPWSWTAVVFYPSERQLACYLVKARPLSRRRLQLTIVGFHHRHECAASLVMASQRICFTPLSFFLSFLPSFSPPSRLVFTCSSYDLLYCQTHSLHYVQEPNYFDLDESNVNTDQTFAIITLTGYQLQNFNR